MRRRRLLQLLPLRPRLLCAPPALRSPALASVPDAARFYRVSSSNDSAKGRRSSNNKSLSQLVLALRTFHSLELHFAVPFSFVVPRSHHWPKELHQLPLGVKVHRFMQSLSKGSASALETKKQGAEQMQELRDMGFPLHSWQEYQFQEVCLPALRTYQEQYGDLFVPQKFIVPEEEDDDDAELWPRATRGYKLGLAVAKLRKQVQQQRQREQQLKDKKKQSTTSSSAALPPLPKNQVDALNELGFVWRDFVVPSEEPWPKDSWGLKLGDTVKNIRRGAYDSQVQAARMELDALGFVWNARHRVEKTVRSVVIPALTTYRRLHGNDALVTTDFVVPDRDPNWPVLTRGFRLGQWITRVRSGQVALSSKLRAELDKVGFVWRSNDQRWNEVLLPAFRAYAELHGGTCASMSTKFSVPPEAPYPRAAWGVNLGGALWHIRNGDSYVNCEDKQRELRTLGILADDAVA
ncbi:hypothetical protein Pcac1_g12743 [Phytophthora cactorum]|nr:hypothetical protein Pcac1_g12743 [Phytophthora cactorum]